jgi:hypothetical protein
MTSERTTPINSTTKASAKNDRIIVFIFCLFFAVVVAYFGKWKGFTIEMTDPSLDNTNFLFLVIITGAWTTLALALRNKIYLRLPSKQIIVAFFITTFLICFFRDDVTMSLRNFASILLTYGFVFFMASLLRSIKIRKAVLVLSVCLFATLCISTIIHVTKIGPLRFFEHDDPFVRLGGLFYYGNVGLISGALGLLAIIGLYLKENKIAYKIFYIVSLPSALVWLGLSDSRSGLLGLVCACAFIVFLNRKKINRTGQIAIITGIVLIGAFYFLYYRPNTTGGSMDVDAFSYRVGIWELSWQGILKSPIVGYGSTSYLANTIDAQSYNSLLADAHSAILGLALQSGLVATGLFLIYFFRLTISSIFSSTEKIFSAIAVFWFVASFFWGDIFLGTAGFIQIVFGIFVLTFLTHPDLYEKNLPQN